jgi:hypothetical protein
MTGCNPYCRNCSKCTNKMKPGASVMRENYELFKSPVARASRLGKYTPMMRKDTFLHRMTYNARPFQNQVQDHSALLNVLIHRLNSLNQNDARFTYYQNQVQNVQNKLNELHQKHGEMMQGRNNLVSYVTANAGNLVPADAINAMVTGDYSAYKPSPIPSPQSAPQPQPELIQNSTAPPPGPIGSLENAPIATPQPTEEAPAPADVNASPTIQPPTEVEDDKNLYEILNTKRVLKPAERAELERLQLKYKPGSVVRPDSSPEASEVETDSEYDRAGFASSGSGSEAENKFYREGGAFTSEEEPTPSPGSDTEAEEKFYAPPRRPEPPQQQPEEEPFQRQYEQPQPQKETEEYYGKEEEKEKKEREEERRRGRPRKDVHAANAQEIRRKLKNDYGYSNKDLRGINGRDATRILRDILINEMGSQEEYDDWENSVKAQPARLGMEPNEYSEDFEPEES